MKEVTKSNRVSWAPEANHCQQKIFRLEDCPSEVDLEASNDLRSKPSNSKMVVSDGFHVFSMCPSKGKSHVNPCLSSEKVVPYIPLIQWKTPPELNLNAKWHVAAGEDSEEAKIQTNRLARDIHAFNLHSSVIPPCPSISLDAEDQHFDDRKTPVIPLIAVEDAEQMAFPSDESAPLSFCFNSQPPNMPQSPSTFKVNISRCKPLPSSSEPSNCKKFDLTTLQDLSDPVAAAAAAATSIMKMIDSESSIDPELLIKLLRNPKMTENLIKEWGPSSSTTNGTSVLKEIEMPLPQQNSRPIFLINKSTFTSCVSGKSGSEAIRNPIERSLHFPHSTPISLVQPRSVSHLSAADGKIRTHIGRKLVTTSVPLPSLTCDFVSEKSSSGEHRLTADAGIPSVMTSSVTLSISTAKLLREKSWSGADQHPSVSLATPSSSMVEPLRMNFQALSSSSWRRTSVSSAKDVNYLRSLVRQHGDAQSHCLLQTKKSDVKYQKPCMFHNRSMGCRNGSNCLYLHDMPQWRSDSGSKRMKLGGK